MARTTKLRQSRDNQRKERTKGTLLDAAEQVFVARGYHPTRISDIVKQAETGQGTFYRHFESKQALFEALFDRLMERLMRGFTASSINLPHNLTEHRELCLAGAMQITRVVRAHRGAILLFLREGPAVGREFQQRLEGFYNWVSGVAEGYLRHGIERGFLPVHDTALVGQSVVGQVLRITTLWLDGRLGERSPEEIARNLVDFSIFGYAGTNETGQVER